VNLLSDLISSFDPACPNFRPTELYSESWLLKLVFRQASTIRDKSFPLAFLEESTWFSEALLPTAFKPRYRGDPLSESRTNADGVIGHILIGTKAKADLELMPKPSQFTVVEAKVGSPLSPGTSNARYFDQAARNVACMAEVLARANVTPSSVKRLDFIALAPQYSIEKGTFSEEMQPSSIRAKVEKRVSAYQGQLDMWYEERFQPTMDWLQLHSVSWEEAIRWIGGEKPKAADDLSKFYDLCLEFK
jgi:hypothetical protein